MPRPHEFPGSGMAGIFMGELLISGSVKFLLPWNLRDHLTSERILS